MLKTRVVTAIIMVAVGLAALFLAPPPLFAALAAVLLLGLGGWEAGRMAGLEQSRQAPVFAAVLLGLGTAVFLLAGAEISRWLLLLGALGWLCLLCWLARPQAGQDLRALKLLLLGAVLLAAWLALVILQQGSPWLVVMPVVVIAAADIGAYFTGRSIGGPKLAPAISPGKTISGAVGGVLAAAAVAAGAAVALPQAPFALLPAAMIGTLLAVLSIGGDLSISLLKRQQGLKDTSAIFPGHGGVLDRFDSLGAALPFFALAWLWWGQ